MEVKIKLYNKGRKPYYASSFASCADCYARVEMPFISLPPGSRTLINLGFSLELPQGYEAQIRPRSSLGFRDKIDVIFGTIDSDYRGELKACVINNSDHFFDIHDGDRICQLYIGRTEQFYFNAVDELSKTERGEGGFGSTGKR